MSNSSQFSYYAKRPLLETENKSKLHLKLRLCLNEGSVIYLLEAKCKQVSTNLTIEMSTPMTLPGFVSAKHVPRAHR